MSEYALTIAESQEAREAVRRFWYEIYVDEMRKLPPSAQHEQRRLVDDLEPNSIVYCLWDGSSLIATLRRTLFVDIDVSSPYWGQFRIASLAPQISAANVSYWSKLAIRPECRDGTLMRRIVGYGYEQARVGGIEWSCLHASPRLAPLYERLGFRAVSDACHAAGVGLLIPMVLVMEDLDHLTSVRSPFRKAAAGLANTSRGREPFMQAFPTVANRRPPAVVETLEELAASLGPPARVTQPRRALKAEGLQFIREIGRVVNVAAGETLQDRVEPTSHIAVILSGVVEVAVETGGAWRPVMALGPGQLFGERSLFPELNAMERYSALTRVELLLAPAVDMWDGLTNAPFGQMALLLLRAASHRTWLMQRDATNGRCDDPAESPLDPIEPLIMT